MELPKVGSIGEYIRDQRKQAKISLRQLATQAGVSNPYLSQIERGLRKPSAEILNQIAKGLRISSQALYVQAGLIEDREPDSDVLAAIRADRGLTERQRQVLIDIYESFRKENLVEAPTRAEQTDAGHTGTGHTDAWPANEGAQAGPEPHRVDAVPAEEGATSSPNGRIQPEPKEG
ncbi:helix-turn-helix domain-containing protein [Sphaerisporangium album]|uniref:Helix-turn-helix domain-containing protein n=1 Tax=Sphaerisporangium album TaxID=509200 RepID=A0A367FQ03_9ACTN|nr:helix-turn-helix domain-containing protein [Sphaerisporangium album]RCG31760.1 helix-turn-helix domain-containing protein [Sphaerisporangium album]